MLPNTFQDLKNNDQALYETWRKNPTPENMGKVVNALMPLAGKEISRASGSLPYTALLSESKKQLVQAIKTYDPSKGAQLSTHATNYLQKVRRANYTYQNTARLPESKQLQFHEYSGAISNLENELGRTPTDEEIAKYLGWSKKQVASYGGLLFKDWSSDASGVDSAHLVYDTKPIFLKELEDSLNPQEKKLMSMLLSPKKIPNPEMAKQLGVSVPTLSLMKNSIKDKASKLEHVL